MTRAALVVILILCPICSVSFVDSLMQAGLGKFLGTFGTAKQVRIPDLLNQMCNQSQGNATRRDACYGCFYRASLLPQGYPMLTAMSACGNTYLNNTNYGHCQAYLRNATSMPDARSPTLIYCSFLECIRQANNNSSSIDVRGASLRRAARQIERRSPFKFLKVLVPRNSVCIIKETNAATTTTTTTTTTTATTTGSIDPRDPPVISGLAYSRL